MFSVTPRLIKALIVRRDNELANKNDVIVQLPLVLILTVHLGHVFQRVEHTLHYSGVCAVHALSNFVCVRADKLALYAPDIDWKVFNKVSHSVAFLASQPRLFYGLDLFSLYRRIQSSSPLP